MNKSDLLGHIDCPSCGFKGGMRVTMDKNLHPFGYCEGDCSQQLRVGPDRYRIGKFYEKYPHLKPVTGTDTEKDTKGGEVGKPAEPGPGDKPAPAVEEKPAKKSALDYLTGGN